MQDLKKQAVEKAILEADKGAFVSQKAVHKWMDSWGTNNELPKPKADIFYGCMSEMALKEGFASKKEADDLLDSI